MKKIVALLMALCLLTGFALAESNEVNWVDVEAAATEIEGDFVAVADLGIKMFVPSVFQEFELSEEELNQGYVCYLATEDESAGVIVSYTDGEGRSLEGVAAGLAMSGAADVEEGTINGIDVVTYELRANDCLGVSMMTDAGYVISFTFSPASDEGFKSVAAIMTASIQPV